MIQHINKVCRARWCSVVCRVLMHSCTWTLGWERKVLWWCSTRHMSTCLTYSPFLSTTPAWPTQHLSQSEVLSTPLTGSIDTTTSSFLWILLLSTSHGSSSCEYLLDRHYDVFVPVDLAPLNITWFLFLWLSLCSFNSLHSQCLLVLCSL